MSDSQNKTPSQNSTPATANERFHGSTILDMERLVDKYLPQDSAVAPDSCGK